MKSNALLWVIVIGIVFVGGYYVMSKPKTTSTPSPAPAAIQQVSVNPAISPVMIGLEQQNSLGQHGTATLSQNAEGKLVVTLALTGGTFAAPQPTHIHLGVCPMPGAVKYPLTNVVNGQSVTTLAVSWDDLVKAGESLAINVHKSAAESTTYTACGNIPLK